MATERFGETKLNLEHLSREEVFRLNVYTHQRLGKALGEVALLNKHMTEHGYYGVREVPRGNGPEQNFEHDDFADEYQLGTLDIPKGRLPDVL